MSSGVPDPCRFTESRTFADRIRKLFYLSTDVQISVKRHGCLPESGEVALAPEGLTDRPPCRVGRLSKKTFSKD